MIDSELLQLKSAGTYRFEIDKSTIVSGIDPLNNVRMLVGFSKIGPFNTPVFVSNTKQFTELFGGIDRTLEKRGSFFHRSCLAALTTGPIYCLNLLRLTNDDKVDVMDFAVASTGTEQTVDSTNNDYMYRGMYNIDTFYTPSEESFLNTIGRSNKFWEYGDDAEAGLKKTTNNLFSFTNIGKTPLSVVVTKASDYNTMNYQVTCQEWYGKGNVPEYLNENSLISDFMVDVYIISGNWGGDYETDASEPYKRFASDIKFSKYFDKSNGLIRRKKPSDTTDTLFNQFLNEPDVKLIGKYTGSLIPGFVDKRGNNIYIEYLVNSNTNTSGIMCAVNEEVFTGEVMIDGNRQGIDMIGHSIYNVVNEEGLDTLRFLSYKGSISGDITVNTEDQVTVSKISENDTYYQITGPELVDFIDVTGTQTLGDVTQTSGDDTQTSSTTSDGCLKIVDYKKTHTRKGTVDIYGYYYKEDENGNYVDPDFDGDATTYIEWMNKVYKDYTTGKMTYVKIDDMVYPVTGAIRYELTSANDNNNGNPTYYKYDYEAGVVGTTGSFSTDVNNAYGAYATSLISHPIIKYKITVSYNVNSGYPFAENTEEPVIAGYYESKEFSKYAEYDENGHGVVFLEGTSVYKNKGSLGTNDQIATASSTTATWDDAIKVDIQWVKPTESQKIKQIEGDVIAHPDYYVGYLTGMFYDADGEPATVTLDENTYCFGSNHELLVKGENTYYAADEKINIIRQTGSLENTVTVLDTQDYPEIQENQFVIEISDDEQYKNIVVGNYVLGKNKDRLSRIIKITKVELNGVNYRLVTCQEEIFKDAVIKDEETVYTVEVFTKLSEWFTHYNVFSLNGFKLMDYHMPDGSNERQHQILDLLEEENEETNLFKSLVDRELIQFRYLVDTFGYGIEENCKAQYTKLCKKRKSAFAIINMPSCNDFQNSEDPSFVDKNHSVSAEYIAKGANPDTNPSFLFTLPDEVNGASWGAYYYPYLKVYSNYSTILVPPAAYVSNNYIEKYSTGTPWAAVAGERRGVIRGNNVIGVESTLIRDSRDWLEPMGVNSIIYRNGIGCEIYANKTAKQKPQSALSSINCREACIYIQDNVERILENYLFEINNAQTRLEIKTLVDNFLDTVKSMGGVYAYKTIMDTSNNDAETIDRNMGVIDIYIEPVRAMEILVQRLTILRTGSIESGTFE